MSVDDENPQSSGSSRGFAAQTPERMALAPRRETWILRRPSSASSRFVLDDPVLLCDALAKMQELEPQFDHVTFLVPVGLGHVLEHAPGERAVAPPLLAEFVDRPEETVPLFRRR